MLIGFICKKHGYINVEAHGQRICPDCQKEKSKKSDKYEMPQVLGFKPFFDFGKMRKVSDRSQVREIERSEGVVLGGHEELMQDAKKNHEEKKSQWAKSTIDKAFKEITDKGIL